MALSIKTVLSFWDKIATLKDIENMLGAIFGYPLALQPGEPIPDILDTFVGWAVDQVINPVIIPALRAQFLDYASGDDLTLRAANDENRPRIEQIAGTQTVTLENQGSFSGTIAVGAIRIAATGAVIPASAGKTYTNTTTGTLAAYVSGPYPTVSLTFEADVAGSSSNAMTGDFTTHTAPLNKGPIGVFVQSVAGPFQGSDEEQDSNLILRIKAKPAELSPAPPRLAYLAIALDPVGSLTRRNITPPSTWGPAAPAITRCRVVTPGNAEVDVYLASASGPAAGDSSTPDTDVYKAWLAMTLILVPFGVATFTCQAATAHAVSVGTVVLTVDQDANVSQPEAVATATTALNAYFANLPIGGNVTTAGGQGYVFADEVISALGSGPGVVNVSISPAFTDVALLKSEVATAGPVFSISANLVTQT